LACGCKRMGRSGPVLQRAACAFRGRRCWAGDTCRPAAGWEFARGAAAAPSRLLGAAAWHAEEERMGLPGPVQRRAACALRGRRRWAGDTWRLAAWGGVVGGEASPRGAPRPWRCCMGAAFCMGVAVSGGETATAAFVLGFCLLARLEGRVGAAPWGARGGSLRRPAGRGLELALASSDPDWGFFLLLVGLGFLLLSSLFQLLPLGLG
jgi:hypothetical protein